MGGGGRGGSRNEIQKAILLDFRDYQGKIAELRISFKELSMKECVKKFMAIVSDIPGLSHSNPEIAHRKGPIVFFLAISGLNMSVKKWLMIHQASRFEQKFITFPEIKKEELDAEITRGYSVASYNKNLYCIAREPYSRVHGLK